MMLKCKGGHLRRIETPSYEIDETYAVNCSRIAYNSVFTGLRGSV